MAVYWCRFLDLESRVYAAERFICADLEEAIAKARAILLDGEGIGFEIWENSRRVYIEQPSQERTR
jgi:hypothetical protein